MVDEVTRTCERVQVPRVWDDPYCERRSPAEDCHMPALTWDDFAKVDCADPREAVTTI